MITLKLEELINGADSLRTLSQKPLKARCAYAVSKILKAAESEMTSFNETRMDLIRKYSQKDENGELVTDENGNAHVLPENIEVFTKELNEVLDTEIDISANKVRIDDLEDVKFTPSEMVQLDAFIEFGEE